MLRVVLEQNLVLPKILLHATRHHGAQALVPPSIIQPPQRASEHQAVKPVQYTRNLILILRGKLLQGRSPRVDEFGNIHLHGTTKGERHVHNELRFAA